MFFTYILFPNTKSDGSKINTYILYTVTDAIWLIHSKVWGFQWVALACSMVLCTNWACCPWRSLLTCSNWAQPSPTEHSVGKSSGLFMGNKLTGNLSRTPHRTKRMLRWMHEKLQVKTKTDINGFLKHVIHKHYKVWIYALQCCRFYEWVANVSSFLNIRSLEFRASRLWYALLGSYHTVCLLAPTNYASNSTLFFVCYQYPW